MRLATRDFTRHRGRWNVLLALLIAGHAAAQTFVEGDFGPGSFTTQKAEVGGGSVTAIQQSGGNPGSALAITTMIPAGSPPGGFCANWEWIFITMTGAFVDPSATGGIASIDFSLDSSPLGAGMLQSQVPALVQGGKIFLASGIATSTSGGWTSTSASGLDASLFFEVVDLPPCEFTDITSHPDFGVGGALIQLGFGRGNSSAFGGDPVAHGFSVAADNWSMTVHGRWTDLGHAKTGSAGLPELSGSGPLAAGSANSLALVHAATVAPTTLVVGFSVVNLPFKGGTLVPSPDVLLGLSTTATGTLLLPFTWPTGVPAGMSVIFQAWIKDVGAAGGLAASNGLAGLTS